MANTLITFDSELQGLIHDTDFDYYGKKIAVAGSDGKISIFELSAAENPKKIADLVGHDNAIFKVTWSHPRFGPLIASCGFDKKIIIWKETTVNNWGKLYEYNDHKNSINTLAFAPNEYGLILLCGSSDGYISLHEYKNENWSAYKFFAHGFGVNSVSWGPDTSSTDVTTPMRFVTCGNDFLIKVWQTKGNTIQGFHVLTTLEAHDDVVREVVWRNNKYFSYDIIASGGDDKSVFLWVNTPSDELNADTFSNNASEWKKFELRRFPNAISKISWEENSNEGNHLLVSTIDGVNYLFKELTEGNWDLISMSNVDGVMDIVDEGLSSN